MYQDELVKMREETVERVTKLAQAGTSRMALMGAKSTELKRAKTDRTPSVNVRPSRRKKARSVSYQEGEGLITQPNWKNHKGPLKISPVNEKLVKAGKHGHGKMVIKESLVPGDTGWGLFTSKAINEGSKFCSYDGKNSQSNTCEAAMVAKIM
jgi:hypothetical protein